MAISNVNIISPYGTGGEIGGREAMKNLEKIGVPSNTGERTSAVEFFEERFGIPCDEVIRAMGDDDVYISLDYLARQNNLYNDYDSEGNPIEEFKGGGEVDYKLIHGIGNKIEEVEDYAKDLSLIKKDNRFYVVFNHQTREIECATQEEVDLMAKSSIDKRGYKWTEISSYINGNRTPRMPHVNSDVILKDGGSIYSNGGEVLAIYNEDSKEIVSRGLTSDMVDDLMYRQNKIKNKNLKVIEDVSDEEISIQKDGSIKLKKGVTPKFLGLSYSNGGGVDDEVLFGDFTKGDSDFVDKQEEMLSNDDYEYLFYETYKSLEDFRKDKAYNTLTTPIYKIRNGKVFVFFKLDKIEKGGSTYKEGGEIEFDTKPIKGEAQQLKNYTHFAIHKPTNSIVYTWEYKGYDKEELDSDKENYFWLDVKDEVEANVDKFRKSDYAIIERKNLSKKGIDLDDYLIFQGQKYDKSGSIYSEGGEIDDYTWLIAEDYVGRGRSYDSLDIDEQAEYIKH